MARITWVTHKGKEILVFDHCKLTEDDCRQQISKVENSIQSTTQKDLLKLSIVSGKNRDTDVKEQLQALANKYDSLIRKEAIIGLKGLRKVFLKATSAISNKAVASFDDIEKAKDWLVE